MQITTSSTKKNFVTMNAMSLEQAPRDYIERSTSHGLPNIFRITHWTVRVMYGFENRNTKRMVSSGDWLT
jgi:hypothetical protein